MFTQLKGQGIIIEILLFMVSMFLAIMTFMILAATDTTFDAHAEAEVEYQANLVREKSGFTLMLEDSMSAAPSIGQDEYGDVPAFRAASYYLSTDGSIDINGNIHSNQDVGNDLEAYFEYKLNQYFGGTVYPTDEQDYELEITYEGKSIEPTPNNDDREGQWTRMDRPLPLSNGETADITFWIKNDNTA